MLNTGVSRGFLTWFVALALMVIASVFASSAAFAGEVVVRMMNRGPAIYKQVVSFREQKYIKIVPQSLEYSCAPASLATILTYYFGHPLSEREAMQGMLEGANLKVVKQKGFSLLDVKRYAERIGYKGAGYKLKADQLLKLKIPGIAYIDVRGYTHFVVLKGIREDKVFVADPAWGNRIFTFEEFRQVFKGVFFVLEGPKVKDAPGFQLDDRKTLPVNYVLRNKGMERGLFTMDPSLSSVRTIIFRDQLL